MNETEALEEKRLTFPARVVGVFAFPRKVFKTLDEKPEWLWAALLGVVISLVLAAILVPRVDLPEQLEKLRENPEITPERLSAIEERFGSPVMIVAGLVSSVIGYAVLLLGKSLIIFLFAMLFISTRAPFAKILSAISYSTLIGILSLLLKAPLMLAKGTRNVEASLAVFANPDELGKFKYGLLASVDIFSIWELVVVSIGLSIIFRERVKKTALIVVPLWVLWRVAVSLIGGVFTRV